MEKSTNILFHKKYVKVELFKTLKKIFKKVKKISLQTISNSVIIMTKIKS